LSARFPGGEPASTSPESARVQRGDDADFCPEMLGIGSDGERRLRRRLEQNGVDNRLVVIGDVGDGRGQGKHHMEVRHGKQFGLTVLQPFSRCRALTFRAMPVAAAAKGDEGVRAVFVFATCSITAQRRCAAALDHRHHLQLFKADMAAIGITPRGAVAAEDVRYLQHGPGHAS
jgi:hypothetical protein